MKRIILFWAIIFSLPSYLSAQPPKPSHEDQARALKGGRVSIVSDKLLLEPNESATLNLKLSVYAHYNAATDEMEGEPTEVDLPDGTDPNFVAPYKDFVWKIVQGGGTLTKVNNSRYLYRGPATKPKDGVMLISADLTPTSKSWPQLTLLQTLYFVDDTNEVAINLPEGGFNAEKYVSFSNGIKMPTMEGMDPRVAAKMSPDLKAKMAQTQAALAASGIDLAAVSGNSMAFYDAPNNLTVLKIDNFALQMAKGKDMRKPGQKGGGVLTVFNFSFKGKGLGDHYLNDNATGAGFALGPAKGCGCGNNQNGKGGTEAPCNGKVSIISMDNNIMKGEIWANVYNTDGRKLVKGTLHGKFSAKITVLPASEK
ncbi:MAG: hypothetical protein ABJA78_04840 [Ferruginibacter sp.]